MDNMKQKRILCAAIWFKDGLKHENQPKNIDNGYVICGRRHHNCFTTLAILKGIKTRYEYEGNIQGFLTTDDMFVNRNEAAHIALDCGQIKTIDNNDKWIDTDWSKVQLFSEDLY